MENITITRRGVLQGAGALVVSWSLLEENVRAAQSVGANAVKPLAIDEVDSFLAISANGQVTVYSGKVDLGTGVKTAMTQIVAEELDVPLARVNVIQGDTLLTPDQGVSSGSMSIQKGGMQLRQAAATARNHLLQLAANKLGTNVADLTVEDGVVKTKPGDRKLAYGDLIGEAVFAVKVDKQAPLKKPADYKIVGTPVPRLDIPGKVTARFTYMQDFRLPGMLHGRVVRPSAIGATLNSVDEDSVKDVPGLVKVIRQGNFLGVVATSEWGAIQAALKLKATWSDWQGLPEQDKLWDYVRSTKIVKEDVTSNKGDVQKAFADATKTLSATYNFPIHTHGSIGPSCAVVEIKDGKLTCWSASQATHNLRKQLALMLSMALDDVRCIYIDGAGCYGRNGHEDAAGDAAIMAKATGQPVRVQWMRQDEHGWDPKGPPTLIDLKGGLDADGNIVAWQGSFYHPNGVSGSVPLTAAQLSGLPAETAMALGNVINNTSLLYEIPNVTTTAHRLESTPFRPSWIRTPGRLQNTFANEAFLDELASAAKCDPLEFRLRILKDARGIELLERLAKLSQWEKRPSPQAPASSKVARGRGLSFVKYENNRTYIGAVAEVEVERDTGVIRVPRIFVAHDCGQIINPDGVKNQIEGNMVQTLSRTLKEEIKFDRSRVTSVDWASYPIITFPEVPEVVIDLIDRPDEKPWGAGEPSAAIVPAAVSNAVFDAIGARLRSVPFTPAKVAAAMRST